MKGYNLPKLRFKNFDDELVTHKTLNITDQFNNLRVPITSSDHKAGNTPYYEADGI